MVDANVPIQRVVLIRIKFDRMPEGGLGRSGANSWNKTAITRGIHPWVENCNLGPLALSGPLHAGLEAL